MLPEDTIQEEGFRIGPYARFQESFFRLLEKKPGLCITHMSGATGRARGAVRFHGFIVLKTFTRKKRRKKRKMRYYANEKNQLMLISLLKKHGIKYVVASPGGTNLSFVASIQHDPWFKIFSCVDERSAAYMACGISESLDVPVVLSCTGATASRNYMPGLTEAFYRKLPILAITSTQEWGNIGQNIPQAIDRSVLPKDIVVESVNIPVINSDNDEWACNLKINTAILALRKDGGGPAHINLSSTWNEDFFVKTLKDERVINRYTSNDILPEIANGKIAIFIGAHKKITEELQKAIEDFCEKYNSVVFVDHTSNYFGKYKIYPSILFQDNYRPEEIDMDLLIYIGDVSGAYYGFNASKVWRVNPDGIIRDYDHHLENVFQMKEIEFFKHYSENNKDEVVTAYFNECVDQCNKLLLKFEDILAEVPFSNLWIASQTCCRLPHNSQLHLGILNTLRSWNYFDTTKNIPGYASTGGFGIDGGLSSAIGASIVSNDQIIFCVLGDLAFFYDMNSIGNRHIRNNLRIILVNNGKGTEFRNYWTAGYRLGDETDEYIAAGRHFGNKSKTVVKNLSENLGFEYITAYDKKTFMDKFDYFTQDSLTKKPILFEVFTDSENESEALYKIRNIVEKPNLRKLSPKQMIKGVIGEKNAKKIKEISRIIKN